MSDQTILQNAPSNLDEDELVDALQVAPPSRRSVRTTRVLSALLLVAVGATGATWWAQRDGTSSAAAGRPSFADGALPGGLTGPPGAAGTAVDSTGASSGAGGSTASGAASSATTGEVVLVDGAKVYVRTSSGSVVAVTTTAGTTVTRAQPSSVAKLAAGDTVSVTGTTTTSGVSATAITAS